ncbi:MAG: hypothetical protein ACRD6X_05950 [Pyrinomonadaceae bacterium]
MSSCSRQPEEVAAPAPQTESPAAEFTKQEPSPSPAFPDLQVSITDDRFKSTNSEIGKFDFRNFTYPLPRGWQHPEAKEITLENGRVKPVAVGVGDDMSDEEKAERKASRRIGMSYVSTRFLDVTGDGHDEAVVILKVETGGSAIPQLVYIYEWKDEKPELIWNFRTGDRADGGLKDIRTKDSLLTVELYGQDRFLLGELETGKITGDEEQLCCPTFFTRTKYKWNGKNFLMQGKRLTYEVENPTASPLENYGDIVNNPQKPKKKK